ncbi:MAG: nucleotide exchange factor GrpE [Planctomycetes bacterium]|nr:nucleotide exchange factor GrpE [Planctomycetota bacterium]
MKQQQQKKKREKPRETDAPQADEKELQTLQERVAALEEEKVELFEKLQRVSADYANFQKRVPKQLADSIGYEKEKIIKTLLPALDNFERTLESAPAAENVDVLVKGIQIIYDQMLDVLKSYDVQEIKALGEQFDPMLHEAMLRKSDANEEDNVILEEYQKGYLLNGRVLRPSKVIVNKIETDEEAEAVSVPEPLDVEQKEDLEKQDVEAE